MEFNYSVYGRKPLLSQNDKHALEIIQDTATARWPQHNRSPMEGLPTLS